jgi:hypothetical protein
MDKAHTEIERLIARKKSGELIFPTDFRGLGTGMAIKQALSRLVKSGKLNRVAHGIYYVPKVDPVLGKLKPGADEVVEKLAKKEKVRVVPAGANALNRLGLSTQVPTRLVYLTDGPSRQLRLGKLMVRFKATSHKKLSRIGKISSLVIQALEEMELQKIDEATAIKLRELLLKEDTKILRHDLSLTSTRVNDYVFKLLKSND